MKLEIPVSEQSLAGASFQDYEPELFGKALPCLSAIGCSLPPDYSLSRNNYDEFYGSKINVQMEPSDGPYNPQPINTVK